MRGVGMQVAIPSDEARMPTVRAKVMRVLNAATPIVLGAVLVAGCAEPIAPGQTEEQIAESTAPVQGAEEIAVLALVNDQQRATFEALDVDCAIRSDAARNIIEHRDGPDQNAGTTDDDRFDTVEELLGVNRVGPKTLELLTECADSWGYLPSASELALVNFLNDQGNTTLQRLDVDCGLYSNAATNLVDHRDGPDGAAGSADDDYFHSVEEVDGVAQVGEATMKALYACAETYGYDSGQVEWHPIPVEVTVLASHPSIGFSQSDGVIYLDGQAAPQGAEITLGFHGHQLSIARIYYGLNTSGVARNAPEGYGMQDLGAQSDGVARIRITKDPLGTITTEQALTIARLGLIDYLQDVRMHQQDWLDQLPSFTTWEAALAEGIMEGIWGFGDPAYDSGCGSSSEPDLYHFWGRGPLGLYTVVRVSKATEETTYFYVEID